MHVYLFDHESHKAIMGIPHEDEIPVCINKGCLKVGAQELALDQEYEAHLLDEAFNKSGANIVITADFDFRTIESEFKNYIKNYKLIMSDIDFTETEPLNIQIENVIWEYWKKNT